MKDAPNGFQKEKSGDCTDRDSQSAITRRSKKVMPIVELYVADQDFNFSIKTAKDFLKTVVAEKQAKGHDGEEYIQLIEKKSLEIIKRWRKERLLLFQKGLPKKKQRLHDIDSFLRISVASYKPFEESGLFTIKRMGVIYARLILNNCQPENFMHVHRATVQLLRCVKALDLYQNRHIRKDIASFAEYGVKAKKGRSHGGKKGAATANTSVKDK
jgi:hypothetical protein